MRYFEGLEVEVGREVKLANIDPSFKDGHKNEESADGEMTAHADEAWCAPGQPRIPSPSRTSFGPCQYARTMKPRVLPSAATWRSMRWLQVAGGMLIMYGLYEMNRDVFRRVLASNRHAAPDHISDFEERLRPIRAALPPNGSYGFIVDAGLDSSELVKRLFLAEYTLAPRLFTSGAGEPVILGVFDRPAGNTLRQQHLQIIQDFGRGILLLKAQ